MKAKKYLSVLLAAAMVAGTAPVSALAEDEVTGPGPTGEVEDLTDQGQEQPNPSGDGTQETGNNGSGDETPADETPDDGQENGITGDESGDDQQEDNDNQSEDNNDTEDTTDNAGNSETPSDEPQEVPAELPYKNATTDNTDESAVASIELDGETYYFDDLGDAVEEANNGDTITLMKEGRESGFSLNEDKAITIDVNGITFTFTSSIILSNDADLTLVDSSENGGFDFYTPFSAGNGFVINGNNESGDPDQKDNLIETSLTIQGGTYQGGMDGSTTWCIIFVSGYGATLNMEGGTVYCAYANTEVSEDDGSLPKDGGYAISGNGTRNSSKNNGGIRLNLTGGEIINDNDVAIYLPCANTTHISGDVTITGRTAIEINSGDLTIEGGTLTATYPYGHRAYKESGDGSYNFGTALAIVSKGTEAASGYYGHMNIQVTGGNFISQSFRAVDIYNLDDGKAGIIGQETQHGDNIDSLSISGGTFTSGGEYEAIVADNARGFITGGEVSTDLNGTGYLDSDYTCTESETDGYYTIEKLQGLQAAVSDPVSNTVTATVNGAYSEADDGEANGDAVSTAGQEVTIDVKATEENITKTEVAITSGAVASLAESNAVSEVTIQTNVADLTFDQTALTAMADTAEDLTLVVEKTTETYDSAYAVVYDLTLQNGAGDTVDFNGGTVTAVLPATLTLTEGSTTAYVYYLGEDGVALEAYEGMYDAEANSVTVDLKHFSPYGISANEQETAVASVTIGNETKNYTDLKEAIAAANAAGSEDDVVVDLLADVNDVDATGASENNGALNITRAMTINGHNFTITAATPFNNGDNNVHLLNIMSNDGKVVINDLNLDGNNVARNTLNVYNSSDVTLNNVDVQNATNQGLVVNGSTVVANELTSAGNKNGGVYVDNDSAAFIMNSGELQDNLVAEGSATTINGGTFDGSVLILGGTGAISGGTFNGTVSGKPDNLTVSGGSFKSDMSSYADDTQIIYEVTADGTYSYYTDVDDALAAAGTTGQIESIVPDSMSSNPNIKTITLIYTSSNTKEIKINTQNVSATFTLPEASRSGYRFLGWKQEGSEETKSAGEQVSISSDTTFTAQWRKRSSSDDESSPDLSGGGSGSSSYTRYTVSVAEAAHGTLTLSDDEVRRGEEVTITVTPDEGYAVETISVTTSNNEVVEVTDNEDGTFTFTMPGRDVNIYATFTEAPVEEVEDPMDAFTDVDEDAWYYDAVSSMVEQGYMNGTSETTFEPFLNLTRAMIAQILYNMEGAQGNGEAAFTDVADSQWYADAVNWAASEGIVSGYGDGTFGPNDPITREQMATILYQYAAYKGYDLSDTASLDAFTDAADVSSWALPYVQWAVGCGIMNGRDNGTLDPAGTATRAEIAVMVDTFLQTEFPMAIDAEQTTAEEAPAAEDASEAQ